MVCSQKEGYLVQVLNDDDAVRCFRVGRFSIVIVC